MPKFTKGARVRLTEEGKRITQPEKRNRVGTVTKTPRKDCVFVRWDDNKSDSGSYYHESFVVEAMEILEGRRVG